MSTVRSSLVLMAALVAAGGVALAAGPTDEGPQPVDTSALPELSGEWATVNPYRDMGEEVFLTAVEIGRSGYNQNCARCHGLEVISGGLAPDLRFLEAEEYGDEWYVERFRHGMTQNGTTKMPGFGDVLGQEAAWAIRSYIETRPDDQQVVEAAAVLGDLRDRLAALAEAPEGADVEALKAELMTVNAGFETLSGAPVADSAAAQAARLLDGSPQGFHEAAQVITVSLSAAN
jgi:cytochrome c-550 PedF